MAKSARRVLVVDDDRDFSQSLADLLCVRGHDASAASSAKEALCASATGEFDAFVVDVKMPEIDGLACLRELRKNNPGAGVIMVTGFDVVDFQHSASIGGALKVLQKPVDVEELLRLLEDGPSLGGP